MLSDQFKLSFATTKHDFSEIAFQWIVRKDRYPTGDYYNHTTKSYLCKTNTFIWIQGVGIDTFGNLSQGVIPKLYDVPITFGSSNQAYLEVEQDEWIYQNGNEKQDLKFEDCVPWKDKTRIASDCSRICLPINAQRLYEENINRPKCQNGSDHICMMKLFMNMVKKII